MSRAQPGHQTVRGLSSSVSSHVISANAEELAMVASGLRAGVCTQLRATLRSTSDALMTQKLRRAGFNAICFSTAVANVPRHAQRQIQASSARKHIAVKPADRSASR